MRLEWPFKEMRWTLNMKGRRKIYTGNATNITNMPGGGALSKQLLIKDL